MKIAIVCYPTFGGSGVVATELGLALSQRGHEVHFVTYRQPVRLSGLNPNVHYHEVVVPKYPLFHYQPYELALSSKLVDTIKQYEIDVLHVHYAIPHAYAGYMARQMLQAEGIYIPMVTTLHGTDITLVGNHPHYKTAVSFSINHSDVVTSVSESLKQDTYQLIGTDKEIAVIPNFIEPKRSAQTDALPCTRSALAPKGTHLITHISNFRKVKRIPDVIAIFARIAQQVPAKLLMVGDGPEKPKAEDQCAELGISDQVLFLGNSSEIDTILRYSDLFLLPSETESFGLAALEAMAWGVPVISSNSGGLPEVNIQGVSGLLRPVGDVAHMAEDALSLLTHPERLQQFRRGAQQVAEQFAMAEIVPQYEAIYRAAMAQRFAQQSP